MDYRVKRHHHQAGLNRRRTLGEAAKDCLAWQTVVFKLTQDDWDNRIGMIELCRLKLS